MKIIDHEFINGEIIKKETFQGNSCIVKLSDGTRFQLIERQPGILSIHAMENALSIRPMASNAADFKETEMF